MKKFLSLIVGICFLFILTGCFSDPVGDEIKSYVNEKTKKAAELEAEAISKYEGVTGTNYQDDETMYNALNDEVIPTYTEFIKELKGIDIEAEELKNIHKTFIDGAEKQLEAFHIFIEALEEQNIEKVESGNALLAEGNELIEKYRSEMKELAEEHNLKLEEIEE